MESRLLLRFICWPERQDRSVQSAFRDPLERKPVLLGWVRRPLAESDVPALFQNISKLFTKIQIVCKYMVPALIEHLGVGEDPLAAHDKLGPELIYPRGSFVGKLPLERNTQTSEKHNIEREKMLAQQQIAEKQLQIARENKNKYDVKQPPKKKEK